MITTLCVNNFKAIPYLETSLLMQTQSKGLKFSIRKPNVIVGPNGTGKSALLETLAIQTLSWFSGQSTLDDGYVIGRDSDVLWARERPFGNDYKFLSGLTVETDNAPALYYRPNHIPGNDDSVTTAMMCGYFNEAKEYGRLTERKSSGQKSLAMLERIKDLLSGKSKSLEYRYTNWRAGKELKDLDQRSKAGESFSSRMPWDYTAEILKKRVHDVSPNAKPLVLMDEPEQSLDAVAELQLWRGIQAADMAEVQIILATHSLYPLLYPDQFNLIEAVPGYIEQVQELMSLTS